MAATTPKPATTTTADDESTVLFERRGHVAILTLNRAKDRNAVSGALARRLEQLVDEFENDSSLWVAIITGNGSVFCAGADLKSVSQGTSVATQRGGFAGFVQRKRTKPIIAAVNGAALAGGCEIALAADLIVAKESAVFGLPEVKRALIAAAGGLFRLPRRLPPNIAMEMVLTGDPISCVEAHRHGLVNKVVKEGECVVAAAEALAARIVVNAPVAVQLSRGIVSRAYDFASDEEGFKASNTAFAAAADCEDFVEGPRAFIEKRPPKWTGLPRKKKEGSKAKL